MEMTKTKKSKNKNTGAVALKHKMVVKTLARKLGKGEKATMTQAMVENGYSQSYAESGQITKKKTWKQLMEEFLPDSLLAETHNHLLHSKEIKQLNFNYKLKDEDIKKIIESEGNRFISTKRFMTTAVVFFSAPNDQIRHKASELGYKVKGKMAPEKFEVENTTLQSLSNDELEALMAKKKAFFNKTD